jgi:hypothetical protein
VKTRIAFITEIGPRLVDPKAKSTEIIDLFRYVDDRTAVEEILKARALTVAKMSSFQSSKPLVTGRGGTLGGRGGSMSGRGRGGRLSGRGPSMRPTQIAKSPSIEQPQPVKESPPLSSSQMATTDSVDSPPPPQTSAPTVSAKEAPPSLTDQSPPPQTFLSELSPASAIPATQEPSPPPSLTDKSPTPPSGSGDEEKALGVVSSQRNVTRNPSLGRSDPSPATTAAASSTPKRRYSKIGVTPSVIKTLGLNELDEISLEGVPLESWEVKARHQSEEVNAMLSDEDRRRLQSAAEIKRTLHRSRHNSTLETSHEEGDEEEEGEAEETPQVTSKSAETGTEDPSLIQLIVRRFSFRAETPATVPPSEPTPPSPTSPVVASSSAAEEEVGVVGWMKKRLSFRGDPESSVTAPPLSTLPQISRNSEQLEDQDLPVPAPTAAAEISPAEEGVVDWIKRRLSFQADPTSPASRSTLPPSSPQLPEPSPQNTPEPPAAPVEGEEQEGVIGFLKRRLSFRSDADLTGAAPPPSALPKRTSTVAKIFSADWAEDPETTAPAPPPATNPTESDLTTASSASSSSPSHPTAEPPAAAVERKERKTMFGGWFKKKSPLSEEADLSSSAAAMDSTTHSLPPPESLSPSLQISTRPKRSKSSDGQGQAQGGEEEDGVVRRSITRPSVKSLQESKRVGFMRGIFEGLTGGKKKETPPQESSLTAVCPPPPPLLTTPQAGNGGSSSREVAGVSPADEKRQFYLAMRPEPPLGTDPLTGRSALSPPLPSPPAGFCIRIPSWSVRII